MVSKTNIHSNIELKKGKKNKIHITISDFFFFDTRTLLHFLAAKVICEDLLSCISC